MIRKSVIAVLAVALLLPACAQLESWTGQTGGNQPGAAADAATTDGQQIAAARQRAYTAPIGQKVTWSNPASGDSGTITTVKDGYDKEGAYCRHFQQTVTSGGRQKSIDSAYCQQPDGSWKPAAQ